MLKMAEAKPARKASLLFKTARLFEDTHYGALAEQEAEAAAR
jgi:hypothetical protein